MVSLILRDLDAELFYACEVGNLLVCDELLKDGANPNAYDANSCTPFFIACRHGHVAIVNLFLNLSFHELGYLNATDLEACTPLHTACFYRHEEVVEALLANDSVDLNLQDNFGDTAFADACAVEDLDIVNLFLEFECHRLKEESILNGLRRANENGHREVASRIIRWMGSESNAGRWSEGSDIEDTSDADEIDSEDEDILELDFADENQDEKIEDPRLLLDKLRLQYDPDDSTGEASELFFKSPACTLKHGVNFDGNDEDYTASALLKKMLETPPQSSSARYS